MPRVSADAEKGEINIEGTIGKQNCVSFFKPINKWLNEYFENPQQQTRFNFKINYLSNSASLMILEIMKI